MGLDWLKSYLSNQTVSNVLQGTLSLLKSLILIKLSTDILRYLKWSLQHELFTLMDWFRANKLTLNLSKSVCMLFNGKKSDITFNLELNDCVLPCVSCTKFLGEWIDEKLNWDRHLNKLVLKIKRNRYLLQCGRRSMSLHACKLVYFAHV